MHGAHLGRGRAPSKHGEHLEQGRASSQHGGLFEQGRASLQHGGLFEQGRAFSQHGGHLDRDRAFWEHGDHQEQARASGMHAGVMGLFDTGPRASCRHPGHGVGGGGVGEGQDRTYGPWTEGGSMNTRSELPDLPESSSPASLVHAGHERSFWSC